MSFQENHVPGVLLTIVVVPSPWVPSEDLCSNQLKDSGMLHQDSIND